MLLFTCQQSWLCQPFGVQEQRSIKSEALQLNAGALNALGLAAGLLGKSDGPERVVAAVMREQEQMNVPPC